MIKEVAIEDLLRIKEITDSTKKVNALFSNPIFSESDEASSFIDYNSACEHIASLAEQQNLLSIVQYVRNISGFTPESYYYIDGYGHLLQVTYNKLNDIIDDLLQNALD